jgi:hypothetical protein
MLNTVCYTICIICIVAAVVIALTLIWGDLENELIWKSLVTVGVFFLASALTLSVNRMIEGRGRSADD